MSPAIRIRRRSPRRREGWELIVDRLLAGEMPPPGEDGPSDEEVSALLRYVQSEFDRADRNTRPEPGRVTAHRLNRAEYANTIRDLLGVEFPPTEDSRRTTPASASTTSAMSSPSRRRSCRSTSPSPSASPLAPSAATPAQARLLQPPGPRAPPRAGDSVIQGEDYRRLRRRLRRPRQRHRPSRQRGQTRYPGHLRRRQAAQNRHRPRPDQRRQPAGWRHPARRRRSTTVPYRQPAPVPGGVRERRGAQGYSRERPQEPQPEHLPESIEIAGPFPPSNPPPR